MNTSYEHAGNSDQLRALQFDPSPRCESCHFPMAEDKPGTYLQIVNLPHDRALFCADCITLATQAGDVNLTGLASMMRELLPESQAANDTYLKALEAKETEDDQS